MNTNSDILMSELEYRSIELDIRRVKFSSTRDIVEKIRSSVATNNVNSRKLFLKIPKNDLLLDNIYICINKDMVEYKYNGILPLDDEYIRRVLNLSLCYLYSNYGDIVGPVTILNKIKEVPFNYYECDRVRKEGNGLDYSSSMDETVDLLSDIFKENSSFRHSLYKAEGHSFNKVYNYDIYINIIKLDDLPIRFITIYFDNLDERIVEKLRLNKLPFLKKLYKLIVDQ